MGRHHKWDDEDYTPRWPQEDPDDEERTVRTFTVPDVPPIVKPEI
jgi:hypothetical protein